MAFLDLQERKDHVMNVPHFNAPWPMDEELCLFADFTAIGTGSGEIEEACDTIKCWYFYGMYVKYDQGSTGGQFLTGAGAGDHQI